MTEPERLMRGFSTLLSGSSLAQFKQKDLHALLSKSKKGSYPGANPRVGSLEDDVPDLNAVVASWSVVGQRALLVQRKQNGGKLGVLYAVFTNGQCFKLAGSVNFSALNNNRALTYPNIVLDGIFVERYKDGDRDPAVSFPANDLTAWTLEHLQNRGEAVEPPVPRELVFIAERCLWSRTYRGNQEHDSMAAQARAYCQPHAFQHKPLVGIGFFSVVYKPYVKRANFGALRDVPRCLVGVPCDGYIFYEIAAGSTEPVIVPHSNEVMEKLLEDPNETSEGE